MWSRRILSVVFSLMCFSGFLFQLDQVSEVYFQYKTSSKTDIHVLHEENYHTIVFCPRYIDMLDRSRYREFGLLPVKPQTNTEFYDELSSLTIKQIFDLTPPTTDVILSCEVRSDNLSDVIFMNSSECHQFFQIFKAISGELVCYMFMPRMKTKYSVGNAASSVTHLTSAYHLVLNSSLAKSTLSFIISHFVDPDNFKDPLHSRMFGIMLNNAKTFVKSGLNVYDQETNVNRLPDPYDTRCIPEHDRQICHEDCLANKFRLVNRATGSGYHHKPLDLKIMTHKDYENKTLEKIASDGYNECHLCRVKTECNTKFSKTTVVEQEYNRLLVRSMVPSGAFTSITTVPLLTLIEYIVQVGSSIGVWFGLSVLSFHPTKWKKMIKPRKQGENVDTHPRRLFIVSKIPKLLPRRQFSTHPLKKQLHLKSRVTQDS